MVPSVVLLVGDGCFGVGPSGKPEGCWRHGSEGAVGLRTLPRSPLLPGCDISDCDTLLPTGPRQSQTLSPSQPFLFISKLPQLSAVHLSNLRLTTMENQVSFLKRNFSVLYLKTSFSSFTLLSGYLFVLVSSRKARAYASGPALTWGKRRGLTLC